MRSKPITRSPLHEAARAYAADGIPVFPCIPNSKVPAVPGAYKAATTDLAQIDRLWTENPNYNVAFSPESVGWCVVDIDEESAPPEPWPDTYTVATPSGGRHLYFEGSLPGTVKKLLPGIDTRGRGSYVLMPPSIVDDKPYQVIKDIDPVPLPAWVSEAVERRTAAPSQSAAPVTLDQPAAIERARARLDSLVQQGRVAVEGEGGDNLTFQVACDILDLGVSPERTLGMIAELWNPHCWPPWPDDELETKVANAARYHQNKPGAWSVPPAGQVFDRKSLEAAGLGKRSRFYFEDESEMEHVQEVGWLIRDILPRESTVLMYGATGSYKSFIALELALAIAYGRETCGDTPEAGLVFYAAAEGRSALKGKRRRAWQVARDRREPSGNFLVGRTPLIVLPDGCQEFEDQIAERANGRPIKLVILDTLAKCMIGLDESKPADGSRLVGFCDKLVERFHCTVLVLHHTGKDEARGARGASTIPAGFDTILRVETNRETKAVALWVVQHKDAEEPSAPFTWEARSIADSLVLSPTDTETHKLLTASSQLTPAQVGAALREIGAIGIDKAVTMRLLAGELAKQPGQSPEELLAATNRIARVLRKLAKTELLGYVSQVDRQLVWYLPVR